MVFRLTENITVSFQLLPQLVCAIIAAGLQYLYTVYALWLVVQTAVLLNTCYLHGKPRESSLGPLKVPEKSITEPIRLTRVFLLVWGKFRLVRIRYKLLFKRKTRVKSMVNGVFSYSLDDQNVS